MPKHISEDIKSEIIEFYKIKPMTLDSLAEKFSISIPSVIKILKQRNIKPYSKS